LHSLFLNCELLLQGGSEKLLVEANLHLNFTTLSKLHHCFPTVMKDTACLQDTWLCIS